MRYYYYVVVDGKTETTAGTGTELDTLIRFLIGCGVTLDRIRITPREVR